MSAPATNRASAAVDRRAWKAARRVVHVQCSRCAASGSGVVNGRGRLVSVNLAGTRSGSTWLHRGCGGVFFAFDIEART